MSKKKICVFVGSRANYSSIKSVMKAIQQHSELTLQLVVGASTLLDRYGAAVELIKKDGFIPDSEIYTLIEGETPVTMAKSTGLGLLELPSVFARLNPDFVLTVGDRFETMATTLAAAYMNIPIAHTMGGEVSGTIDESIRHAVTKFAHVHFPASPEAAERIIKLGEKPDDVHLVGCPRIDLVAEILSSKLDLKSIEDFLFSTGVGDKFSLNEPFILVSQHPVTTEYGEGELQISKTLEAVRSTGLPAVILWPNADAGSEDIARGIRKWREKGLGIKMRFFTNLPIEIYVHLMKMTCCLVGNSSSGIREGAFIGTPVVNVGSRQTMRERGDNVIEVPCDVEIIKDAILKQVTHGRYSMNSLYGDGNAGKLIADILSTKQVNIQKRICY
jgi:UDP-hydrolysing UDP-N-acetyl-D-glucosamine 2-epimerase